jgi:triosephosphate isomerase
MRRHFVAGNWKMHKTNKEAIELARRIEINLRGFDGTDVVLCPPFTALESIHNIVKESKIELGAQNMYYEDMGAYTGEISSLFLIDMGVKFVILGHSERRAYFGESDELIAKKIKAALRHNLTPILCVGEKLKDREEGITKRVIETELEGDIGSLEADEIKKIIVAYEPIWAIGTGKTCEPDAAENIHSFIREWVERKWNFEISDSLRILYGGSVKPGNIESLITMPDIDGALVGGASLVAESFVDIVKKCG